MGADCCGDDRNDDNTTTTTTTTTTSPRTVWIILGTVMLLGWGGLAAVLLTR